MEHPKSREWDRKLKELCDRLDRWLEKEYRGLYRLRANRPREGETANPEMDGLFNVQAVFTPGYGSQHGRGYILEVELATWDKVDEAVRAQMEEKLLRKLQEEVCNIFPNRKLEMGFDGNMLKIWGDLSLGSL